MKNEYFTTVKDVQDYKNLINSYLEDIKTNTDEVDARRLGTEFIQDERDKEFEKPVDKIRGEIRSLRQVEGNELVSFLLNLRAYDRTIDSLRKIGDPNKPKAGKLETLEKLVTEVQKLQKIADDAKDGPTIKGLSEVVDRLAKLIESKSEEDVLKLQETVQNLEDTVQKSIQSQSESHPRTASESSDQETPLLTPIPDAPPLDKLKLMNKKQLGDALGLTAKEVKQKKKDELIALYLAIPTSTTTPWDRFQNALSEATSTSTSTHSSSSVNPTILAKAKGGLKKPEKTSPRRTPEQKMQDELFAKIKEKGKAMSGEGILQPRSRKGVQMEIVGGKLGSLKFDMDKLKQLKMKATQGGKRVMDGVIPYDLFALLTKKFNPKIEYSPSSIEQYRKILHIAGIPIGTSLNGTKSKKLNLVRGQSGSGYVKMYDSKDPDALIDRLRLIVGSISSGNSNPELVNESSEILDVLKRKRVITIKEANKILKNIL